MDVVPEVRQHERLQSAEPVVQSLSLRGVRVGVGALTPTRENEKYARDEKYAEMLTLWKQYLAHRRAVDEALLALTHESVTEWRFCPYCGAKLEHDQDGDLLVWDDGIDTEASREAGFDFDKSLSGCGVHIRLWVPEFDESVIS